MTTTMKKKGKKSDAQIVTILDQHIRFTTGYVESNLSKERERVLEYYDGALPKPTHAGNSKYVSQDVFEEVQSLKATLLETFSTNHKIVQFDPSGPNDVEPARIATEYCSYIVFRQNPGFSVLGDVIEDGLLARVGIAQFSWEESQDEIEEETEAAPLDQLVPIVSQEDVKLKELEDQGDGTYVAKICRYIDTSQVVIEAVPPEDFGITARAKDVKSAKLVYRRHAKTMGELREEGYSDELLDTLVSDSSEMLLDSEKAARYEQLDDQRIESDDTVDLDGGDRTFTVYECYAKMDVEGTGIAKLWRIVKCCNTILKKEKVRSRPFACFIPIPKSHAFQGSNFADKVRPLQNARTVLTRAILDHTVITTAPRWQVVKGGLMNPRELMDNRVGGLVNVTRPDAIAPLPQAPMNPFVFQTLGMLDQNKEDVTGVSRLSKGLNKDAVSNQNSQGLVEDLVSLSERRQKIIARQFSEFLRELYVGVYQLVLDHEDRKRVFDVAGNWVDVDPQTWRDRKDATAEIAVGYGEQEKEGDKYIMMDTYLGHDPALAPMYTTEKRYNTLRRAMEKKGVRDIDNFLVPPAQQQPPQPDPLHMAQVQATLADAKAKEASAQAALLRVQFEREKWLKEHELEVETEVADHAIKSDALALKERTQAHREAVDAAEIAMSQQEIEGAKVLVHPNG
jgi:hypothetical protein